MPPLAIAVGAGALVGGAATVVAAGKQSKASGRAASAQERATQASLEAQERGATTARDFLMAENEKARGFLEKSFGDARAQIQNDPFLNQRREIGLSALRTMQESLDPSSSFFQNERKVATDAVSKRLASQGLLRSGRQSQLLTDIELGLARERFNRASLLAGQTPDTASSLSNLDLQLGTALAQGSFNLGNQVSSIFSNLGANQGSALQAGSANIGQLNLAGAQAQAQGITGLANLFNSGLSNFLTFDMAQKNAAANSAFQSNLLGALGGK